MSRAYRFKYAAFAVVLALSLQIQAGADVPSTGLTVSQQLANIENQLFEHSYANDNEEARLARLELFVFGVKSATSSGSSLQARLNRIERVVVTDPDGNPATPYVQPVVSIGGTAMPPKAPPIGSGSGSSARTAAAGNLNPGKDGPAADGSYPTDDYGNYPRVTQLEQQLLGKTYETEPVPVRLSRLEDKAFGKSSPDLNMADRVDRLDRMVPQSPQSNPDAPSANGSPSRVAAFEQDFKNAIIGSARPVAQEPERPTIVNPFTPGAPQVQGVEARVGAMEEFVFGHRKHGDSLAERVQHLEKRLVPYAYSESDDNLGARVGKMWGILSSANAFKRSGQPVNE